MSAPARKTVATVIVATTLLLPITSRADRHALPPDFDLSPVTFGGAGGGTCRDDAITLSRCPVILVPDRLRDHTDWTGQNTGALSSKQGDIYAALLEAGFQPIEIWMIDFAPAGHHMTSFEEATDDLKFFITSVMAYTGADRVQLVAHGAGGILTRLALLKYNIAHWVAAEVYIDTPFHGTPSNTVAEQTLAGDPNAWVLQPDSPLLREILVYGETPAYPDPVLGIPFGLPTLTIRGGTTHEYSASMPPTPSPALRGAENRVFPNRSHDALRCSPETVAVYAAFLNRPQAPLDPMHDEDGDGFRGKRWGGPDFDDHDPSVYPGAFEIAGDGIDQDCNGCDQAPHGGREIEIPILELKPEEGCDHRR